MQSKGEIDGVAEGGGDAWDNMMRPFDQDVEEQRDSDECKERGGV